MVKLGGVRHVVVLVALLVAASCGTPVPSVTPIDSAAATPATPTHPSATAGASSSPASELPLLATIDELPVTNVLALAPASEGAWFTRLGEVGLVSQTRVVRRAQAGPLPVAIAGADDALFVVEGFPEGSSRNDPRVSELERIDPSTLKVVRHTPLRHLVTDLAYTGGLAWTIDTDGTVTAFDATTLKAVWTSSLQGSGPAKLAIDADGAIWAAIGNVEASTFNVARIDVATHARTDAQVHGSGTFAKLAAGSAAWIAVPDDPVYDWLYRISPDGSVSQPVYAASPADLAVADDRLWIIGSEGSITVLDTGGLWRTPAALLSGDGIAVVATGDVGWAASTDAITVLSLH